MKPFMRGLVLLVLTAALLQPTMAARALTSEQDKELVKPSMDDKPPKGDKPDDGKLCIFGIECNGTCKDQFNDTSNCGECGKVCPKGAVCKKGKCECPKDQELCEDKCLDKGTCTPVEPEEPECVNNAISLLIQRGQILDLCRSYTGVCAPDNVDENPPAALLCSLDLPTFDLLPPNYQALLESDNCFLNGTSGVATDVPESLRPWCACLQSDSGFANINTVAVLNFVGVNSTTGEASPPAGLTAPEACAGAPFVPFKDLYLCDRPGLPGGSCRFFTTEGCPSDAPISQWDLGQPISPGLDLSEETICRRQASLLVDRVDQSVPETTCLPVFTSDVFAPNTGDRCQLQSCPCAPRCPTNVWSVAYNTSFWQDSYCPAVQVGECATDNTLRPTACDLTIPRDVSLFASSTLFELCPELRSVSEEVSETDFDFRSAVCGCLTDATSTDTELIANSLNALLGFNFTTLSVTAPQDVEAPAECSNATFVPARNLYVCDAEGVETPADACQCPKSSAFFQWVPIGNSIEEAPLGCYEFVTAAAEGGKCLAPTLALNGEPFEIGKCRISTCPCPEAPAGGSQSRRAP